MPDRKNEDELAQEVADYEDRTGAYAECQWHPTKKCPRPVVGRFAVTSGAHALCAYHLGQLDFTPRRVS